MLICVVPTELFIWSLSFFFLTHNFEVWRPVVAWLLVFVICGLWLQSWQWQNCKSKQAEEKMSPSFIDGDINDQGEVDRDVNLPVIYFLFLAAGGSIPLATGISPSAEAILKNFLAGGVAIV